MQNIENSVCNFYNNYVVPFANHKVTQTALLVTREAVGLVAAGIFLTAFQRDICAQLPESLSAHSFGVKGYVLILPVFEEIIFRLVLQRGIQLVQKYRQHYIHKVQPSPEDLKAQEVFRVRITAVLYALCKTFYRQNNPSPLHFIGHMLSGLTYGYLSEKYSSLALPILAHGFFNGLGVAALVQSIKVPEHAPVLVWVPRLLKFSCYLFAIDEFDLPRLPSRHELALKVNEFFLGIKNTINWIGSTLLSIGKYFGPVALAYGFNYMMARQLTKIAPENSEFIEMGVNIAPIVEEFMFRWALLNTLSLLQKGKNYVYTRFLKKEVSEEALKAQLVFRVRVQAVLFGFVHYFNEQKSIIQVVLSGIGGLTYGYLAEKYDTIALGVIAHGINNGLASLAPSIKSPELVIALIGSVFVNKMLWYMVATDKLPSLAQVKAKVIGAYEKGAGCVAAVWQALPKIRTQSTNSTPTFAVV